MAISQEACMRLARERYGWARAALDVARMALARNSMVWAVDRLVMAEFWRACAREWRNRAADREAGT